MKFPFPSADVSTDFNCKQKVTKDTNIHTNLNIFA